MTLKESSMSPASHNPQPRSRRRRPQRGRARPGQTLIIVIISWAAICGFVSLGVDLGRARLAKSQLSDAASAAARRGVYGLDDGTAVSKAIAAAADNTCDGDPVVLQPADVEIGVWDAAARTFTPTAGSPNAVRVTARRTAARGNPIPTPFAALIGRSNVDAIAVAVATITTPTNTQINVPGTANPWLAGMPAGTTANGFDSAPTASPTQVQGLNITPGACLNFNFTGSVSYYPGTQPFNPDGNPNWIINNWGSQNGGEHGIANVYAPLTSVIGVFLDDNLPTGSPPPASLDFSTAASRDFASLAPQLKQPFFIGDGLSGATGTVQQFIVPAGATRLFLGVVDGSGWLDNVGSFSVTVHGVN